VRACVRQCYSFLTRKYNVYDGERITTLFSYRGNNTSRNRITCDAVGNDAAEGVYRYVVLGTVCIRRGPNNQIYGLASRVDVKLFSISCVVLPCAPTYTYISIYIRTYVHISILYAFGYSRGRRRARESGKERMQYKRAFIILYRTVVPIHRTRFTTTPPPPPNELASNTI
jgi:hypothetical protein